MIKFKFLGTSAGEQYPGFWCRCPNCNQSRTLGGKNIRKNSSAYILPDCLIDLPAEAFMQAERYGIQLVDTKYLLVTHSDKDHLFPYLLRWRYLRPGIELPPSLEVVGPRFSGIERLHICGNKKVCKLISEELDDVSGLGHDDFKIELHQIEPSEELSLGAMSVKALRANHGNREDALNFVVQRDDKTIFYGLDTGWFLSDTYEEIRKYEYDLVVLEATFGDGAASDGHFNFQLLRKARRLFEEDRLLRRNGIFCASHFCPHFSPVYDVIAPQLAREGITAAYDGLELEV